jgi:hypothetical protein
MKVTRVLTPEQATAIVGDRIPDNLTPSFPSPKDGEVLNIFDADTDELIAIVSRMLPADTLRMRQVTGGIGMANSGRRSARLENWGSARTFGWLPRRPLMKREGCGPSGLATNEPDANAFLTRLGGWLGDEFRRLAPGIAAHDLDLVSQAVHSDWLMEERALWTSGVVNRSSQLPYHRDSTNFPTWSAMPTIRYRMRGGHLHLPEYNIVFPCGDGDVTWFCGQEFVHGVTPMWTRGSDAYRFSVVYYALRGMKNCATVAEETASLAVRRTERERRMAEETRARLREGRTE